MDKKYDRFKTEEELLKSVLHSLPYNVYPKVSAIGGKRINPDIDILQIKRISENQFQLIGYEIKLMRFNKRSKGLSWSRFYSGIGQALLYLKNGVHRAALVLGFHENIFSDKLIDEFYRWMWDNKELLKRIFGNHISIGLCLYKNGSISMIIEADHDFHPLNEKIRLLSTELLHRKFSFNKKLIGD